MTTTENERLTALTREIINAAFEVSNTLGCGFLEKLYERALIHELKIRGLTVESQTSFSVTYKEHCLGEYHADIVVENTVLVELKCTDRLAGNHVAQCLNYLRAADKDICLLINFQKPIIEWKRIVSPRIKNLKTESLVERTA